MPRRVQSRCECCGLNQTFLDRGDGIARRSDSVCSHCEFHRGPLDDLKRAQDHERLVRDQLHACRTWAEQTQREISRKHDQVRAAYQLVERSRNHERRAYELIGRINDLHTLRPNGECTCGKRDCPTAAIVYQDWVQAQLD